MPRVPDARRVRPDLDRSELVRAAPGRGDGSWAGAPDATLADDGTTYLVHREREGHDGVDRDVLSRSDDGVRFETVGVLEGSRFGGRWVERASLVRTPEDRWRLYVCTASTTDASWWVEALEAPTVEALSDAPSRVVVPATPELAFKDPVVRVTSDGWEALVCAHLLDEPGEEDRMRTVRLRSDDGWTWTPAGTALDARPGHWDARGVRVSTRFPDGSVAYDGRASAAENWFERSGVALPGPDGGLAPDDDAAVLDVRYVEALPLPDGAVRLYWEQRLPDLTHELRTSLTPAPA